jgi:hypothetical protein
MVNGETKDWTGSRYHFRTYFYHNIFAQNTHIIAYTLVLLRWSVLYLTVVNQIQMNSLTGIYPRELYG